MEKSHKRQDLLCCICLEFLESPKVLSCSHVFCEKCLQTTCSADKSASNVIICRRCKAPTSVPQGGVASLQTNDVIAREASEAKTSSTHCPKHPGNALSSWCADCENFLCKGCESETQHRNHTVILLAASRSWPKAELVDTLPRVSLCRHNVASALDKVIRREELIRQKQAVLEDTIRQRQKVLLQSVLDATVKSLTMLESSSQKVLASLHVDKMVLMDKLRVLEEVEKSAAEGGSNRKTLSPKHKTKLGSKEHLQEVNSDLPFHGEYPVMHYADSFDDKALLDFIGHVTLSQPIPWVPEVTITTAFHCGTDPRVKVHALCPTRDGKVWVAYQQPGEAGDVVSLYNGAGKVERMQMMSTRVCLSRLQDDWILVEGEGSNKALFMTPERRMAWVYTGPAKQFRLYSKLRARFYLCLHKHGSCDLRAVVVRDGEDGVPATSGAKLCDVALSRPPRAVDVCGSGEIVAVLEEEGREVLFFKSRVHDKELPTMGDLIDCKPYAKYSRVSFQPVDLSFGSFGKQECLVVADWLNDVLVLLHVTAESCAVIGQVGGGSAELFRPTAVTCDESGRLWVGCEGGKVLMVEQLEGCVGRLSTLKGLDD